MLVVDSSGSIASAGAEGAVTNRPQRLHRCAQRHRLRARPDRLRHAATVARRPLDPAEHGERQLRLLHRLRQRLQRGRPDELGRRLVQGDRSSGADLTLFITDGMPNEYESSRAQRAHGESVVGEPAVVVRRRSRQRHQGRDGSRMFVVGVGEAASHTTEIVAVSGPNGPGLNVAVNDFSLTSNFDDLAASLRALVFSLCQSTMTVTKLVDGQPANGWDVTATITDVTGASGFDLALPVRDRRRRRRAARSRPRVPGRPTFDWVVGSEANPVPTGSVEMTIDEETRAGFRFTGWHVQHRLADRNRSRCRDHRLAVRHRDHPVRCHRALHAEQRDDPGADTGGADRRPGAVCQRCVDTADVDVADDSAGDRLHDEQCPARTPRARPSP